MNRITLVCCLMVISLLLVSCNFPAGSQPADRPPINQPRPDDSPGNPEPSEEPSATAPSPTIASTPSPTDTPTPENTPGPATGSIIYQTEFDNISGWNSFAWWRSDVHTLAGSDFKTQIATYVTEIRNETYYFEVPKKYTNITSVYAAITNTADVTIVADTILTIDRLWTFISVACRYEDNVGWYEFYIQSNGSWGIRKISYVSEVLNEVKDLATGVSSAINYGEHGALNVLQATCQGDNLIFSVNGVTLGSAKDSSYVSGVFGVGVAAGEQGNSLAAFERMSATVP